MAKNSNDTKTVQISIEAKEALEKLASETKMTQKEIIEQMIYWVRTQFGYKRNVVFGNLAPEFGEYRAHLFMEQVRAGMMSLPKDDAAKPASLSPPASASTLDVGDAARKRLEKNLASQQESQSKTGHQHKRA